jgi:hypothetical protein
MAGTGPAMTTDRFETGRTNARLWVCIAGSPLRGGPE